MKYIYVVSLRNLQFAFSSNGASGWNTDNDLTNSPNSITLLRFMSKSSNTLSTNRLSLWALNNAQASSSLCIRPS